MNLTTNWKATRVSNAVAAGQTDINSSSVDMSGFESATFIVSFGTVTSSAVTSIKAQQSADDSSFADLASSGITVTLNDSNKLAILEVVKPTRYVRCVVDRGTGDATVDGIVALQGGYFGAPAPVTHDSTTVIGSEVHHAPSEGTA